MEVVNNLVSNHLEAISNILDGADTLYIVSPFMSDAPVFYKEVFEIFKQKQLTSVCLVTTLEDNSPDLLKKANAFYYFGVECIQSGIKYSIKIDNKLHGKLYISKKDSQPIKGIITSANFTQSGLKNQHEWGIISDNEMELLKVIKDVENNSISISYDNIREIIKRIDGFKKSNDSLPKQLIDIKVSDILNKNQVAFPKSNSKRKYFIKPVGWTEKPFDVNRILSSTVEELHFAKRPAVVSVGDIIICYGVGTTKLLGYFEVISDKSKIGGDTRWPWMVKAKNLCPKYSERWNMFSHTLANVKLNYSGDILTFAGNTSLGALQHGHDKVRLDEHFAFYLINAMESSI
ncbi:TPA: NgoFVII family restriction endonuclease [Bacillus wiedmannii]|nr:NgoFVII family restriction endonuclease [Bacillus wiedmannii]